MATDWPKLKPHQVLKIEDRSQVPALVIQLERKTCPSDIRNDWLFFLQPDNHAKFLIIQCNFGVGSESRLYSYEHGKLKRVDLNYQLPNSPKILTNGLGSFGVDNDARIVFSGLGLAGDTCGLGEHNPILQFVYKDGTYLHYKTTDYYCETGTEELLWREPKLALH